jgi:hypothetical protein
MQENIKLKWALWYAEKMNFSVIPIRPGDKKALIPWAQYQKEKATPDQIAAWWEKTPTANIGIVTGSISDLNVIDIDSDEGRKNIEPFLPDSFITPMVNTPRGGLHYYCRNTEGLTNNAGVIPGTDLRANGGYIVAPVSANGNGKAYTWTENGIGNTPLMHLPDAYIKKISTIYGNVRNEENNTLQSLHLLHLLQEGTRDNDLFHIFNCLSKGGYERELSYKLAEIIAKSCNPVFDIKEAITKVDSAYSRTEKKDGNLNAEIRDWVLLQERYIYVTECYEALHLLHSKDKTNCRVILHRLCKEGALERISQGTFKKIDQDCQDIDIWDADTTTLDIKYPFEIETYVDTYPKNIIVVAGEPNAGKTAFLLNFAKKNMEKHEVIYFSSEMGGIELKSRLLKFNLPMDVWKQVTWKERASDFAAMIRPNAINIIDFLEVHEEFYKVGLFIKQIFDKLEKGIAIIAIQKPKGRDEGLGGQRGLEKPRLYLAMEPGLIRIVKGKNWKHEMINPNGKTMRWKLAAGCKFKNEGDWEG